MTPAESDPAAAREPLAVDRKLDSMSKPDGLSAVRAEIVRGCRDAGRDPAGVTTAAHNLCPHC